MSFTVDCWPAVQREGRLKILNVMLSSASGGLERAAVDAHDALTVAGCTVTTVLRADSWAAQLMREKGLPVSSPRWSPFDFATPSHLSSIFRSAKIDAVLAHGRRAILMSAKARGHSPIIGVTHNTNYSITKILNKMDGVIALTSHYKDMLVAAGYSEQSIRLVPNCIRIGQPPTTLPFENDVPIIGALGRLHPNKGFDVLIDACAILKKEGVRYKCVVHGDGDPSVLADLLARRDKLGLTAEDIDFAGWTDDPAAFLRTMDIFCMSSRREVLSIALLEGLAAGRPVVCTRVPGLEDAFDDGREGLFVGIGDPADLAAALTRILNNPTMGRDMGSAARARALRFDISVVGPELKSALAELSTQALGHRTPSRSSA